MDDTKIVQLYLDRNERAIPETANKYGNYCTSIAKNILGSQDDAEECGILDEILKHKRILVGKPRKSGRKKKKVYS